MAKLHVKTYGCQMNEYDSSMMADILAQNGGYRQVSKPDKADLVLLNTCSVREKAQEKLFGELGRLREIKRRNPNMLIGVGGCVASQEGWAVVKRAPCVDIVFGPQTLHRLPDMVRQRRKSGKPQVDVDFPGIEKFDDLPAAGLSGPTALVSVMEGCSKYCSFCVVPYTRGPEVSRPLTAVLEEIAELTLRGVREVTLLGQNVNAYASDDPGGGTADFARLLECVCCIAGISRVRYTTSHPLNFTPALINAHRDLRKLMPSVHLPVQSGDDRVLAMMKRGHTAMEYRSIVRRLRKACPLVSLTSDFIVGFPGETAEQFAQTLKFVRQISFDGGYCFVYSSRPGTPAATIADPVPAVEKKRRLHTLQETLDNCFSRRSAQQVGKTVRVLVEGPDRRGELLSGRAPDNRVVNFAGNARPGDIVGVLVTAAMKHTLKGHMAT